VFDRPEHMKQYYIDHREERLAYSAAYRADHKEQARVYDAAYYEENKDAMLEKMAKECAEFTEWLQILRANNGCEDCGTHEGRLDHHHVDPSTKLRAVSEMYSYSLDALEEELEKCVVLCASCHTKRHAKTRALVA